MLQFWMLWVVIAGSIAAGGLLAWRGGARLRGATTVASTRAPLALVGAVAVAALLVVVGSGRLFVGAVAGWQIYPFLAGQIAVGALLAAGGAGLGCAAARRWKPPVAGLARIAGGGGTLLGGLCLGMAGVPFVAAALWALLPA